MICEGSVVDFNDSNGTNLIGQEFGLTDLKSHMSNPLERKRSDKRYKLSESYPDYSYCVYPSSLRLGHYLVTPKTPIIVPLTMGRARVRTARGS